MHKRNGLALLLSLVLLAMALATALLLASLAVLEQRHADVSSRRLLLRQAAESAALRGLAELQASLGPDQAHDHQDEDGGLVAVAKAGRLDLAGRYQDGPSACSWRMADLSLGHDASAKYVAQAQASAWSLTSAGRAKLPHALPVAPTPNQRVALAAAGRELFGLPLEPGTTWQVRGLLTDPVRGGWRKDLMDEVPLTEELGAPVAKALRHPAFGQSPAKGYPPACAAGDGATICTLPRLVDFRLSLGFFNSRSDGRHRLRFHGSAVFWNPLSVPILAGPQGKLFLSEIVGSPEVTVTNLETQSSFTTDLDDCPQEDFGIIRQGLRERGLWFWAEVADPATHGMAGRGLLPGEVYALVNPSAESQPQGLARILTRTTWRMDRSYHGPGGRRPEPTVFLPDDRIEIAVRFRGKVGIRLRPYAGEPTRDEAIADYPAPPIILVEGVTFPDFIIRTTGEDYSREDSSGYVIEERRACLRIRLRRGGAGELWSGHDSPASKRSWNLADPADAAEWSVDHPVLSALDIVDHDASPLAGRLWDLRANRHEAGQAGAFASVRLRDFPGAPLMSAGALRHLEAPGSKAWMERLDRTFCSAGLSSPEPGVISHNPFLISSGVSVPRASPEAAKGFYVVGPFNVNSRDPKAWAAFLRDAGGTWMADRGGPFDPQELTGPVFFTRPTGAALAKWGASSSIDLPDKSAADLPAAFLEGLAAQQGVRCLDESKLVALAEKIVAAQSDHGWPFASLRVFAESGLLAHALKSAEIDRPFSAVAPELPMRLREEDLLEAWAPILAVRGDTFTVEGRAEGSGGSSVCELLVQRVAAEHPVPSLGRRFRIISVRFRNR